jgi:hypothetical protein
LSASFRVIASGFELLIADSAPDGACPQAVIKGRQSSNRLEKQILMERNKGKVRRSQLNKLNYQ